MFSSQSTLGQNPRRTALWSSVDHFLPCKARPSRQAHGPNTHMPSPLRSTLQVLRASTFTITSRDRTDLLSEGAGKLRHKSLSNVSEVTQQLNGKVHTQTQAWPEACAQATALPTTRGWNSGAPFSCSTKPGTKKYINQGGKYSLSSHICSYRSFTCSQIIKISSLRKSGGPMPVGRHFRSHKTCQAQSQTFPRLA